MPSGNSKNITGLALAIVDELVMLLVLFFLIRLQDLDFPLIYFSQTAIELPVYGMPLLMLLVTGLLPDFFRCFVYSLKKQKIMVKQVKRSLLSVKLAMATAVTAQLLASVYSFALLWDNYETYLGLEKNDASIVLAGNLSVWGGMFVHGLVVAAVLLPVYARMKIRLISMGADT